LTIWNATKNASATGPAPSSAATIESRAKPKSREASVPEDTVRKERIMKTLIAAPLAGAGFYVIGRSTFSTPILDEMNG